MEQKHKILWCIGIFVVLLVIILVPVLFFLQDAPTPPDETDVMLHGIELNENGKIVYEGDLHLRYTSLTNDGGRNIKSLELKFRDIHCPPEYDSALIGTYIGGQPVHWFTGFVYVKDTGYVPIEIHTNLENGWYLLKIAYDNRPDRYIIASSDKNIDISDVLHACDISLSAPEIQINWTMQAAVLSAEGNILKSFFMSVKGEILEEQDGARLDLDIVMPDTYRYMFDKDGDPVPVHTGPNEKIPNPYYVASQYSYDKQKNEPRFAKYAIDTDKQYLIISWDDGTGSYLVASVDPVPHEQIAAHFQKFLDTFAYKSS